DINECANSPYPCLSTQRCTNIQGSYQCLSAVCTANPNTCNDANAQCISTSQGSGYTCNCNTNLFTQSNGNQNNAVCTDINECLLPVNLYCGSSQVCLNSIGGFTCQAEQCNSERCGLNKLCTNINVQPGYACSCAPGFVTSLQNSNNCVLPCDNNPCQANSACTNNGNSFTCTCNSGFKLVNNVCVGKSLLHNENK
uniref:EGF-like domain-containing protein n=1 Tax=Clytia hemisphaerica TaxID=252671 RepID=A0A7M5VEZ3_9CNID